jgi:hypothetical protein
MTCMMGLRRVGFIINDVLIVRSVTLLLESTSILLAPDVLHVRPYGSLKMSDLSSTVPLSAEMLMCVNETRLAMYMQRNVETRWCNHFCSGQAISTVKPA